MAASLLVPAAALVLPSMPSAHAAVDVQALVTQAEHNTNTVGTLMHHDTSTITTPARTVTFTAQGQEDETRNREKDFESVDVTSKTSAGKTQHLHYTADIVFINGTTYYRISAPVQNNTWKSQKGATFNDPYTGGWKRGRTAVTFPKSFVFKQVGVSGGQTQVRANFTTAQTAGTVDLWISSGSKPYVVKEVLKYHATKSQTGTANIVINLGPFNTSLTILAPTVGGTA